jgi:hypothetical protein
MADKQQEQPKEQPQQPAHPSPKHPEKRRTTYRRLTGDEDQKCLQHIRKLLTLRNDKGDIKRAIIAKYGISVSSFERRLSRVRRELLDETEQPIDEHRSDAYHFYLSVLRDRNASHRDRLKAAERIDKLLGLERQQQTKGSNVNLNLTCEDLENMTDDELIALERRIAGEN